jgi:hypothetical protein
VLATPSECPKGVFKNSDSLEVHLYLMSGGKLGKIGGQKLVNLE